ncbi:MAG: NUDIX domain-containing protein [Rhodobiaceae bacterium]|nr:NUDIX domain-containing protein [Rhodobiaceae bacterium]
MATNKKSSKTAKGAFDPKEARNQEYRQDKTPAVRPKEAATLIIVRRDAAKPRILMGKRAAGHKFMPNKFVFPGGRMDAADSRVKAHKGLRAPVERRLLDRMRGTPSPNKARGLAMAAIRETFEETGLVIGKKVSEPLQTRNPEWQAYYNEHVAPDLSAVDFIARAITPPYRNRRFDTRFFMIDADQIQGDLHDTDRASGELLELHWLEISDAFDLDLPNITRMILSEMQERLDLPKPAQARRPVPFVHFRGANPVRDTL